MNLANKQTKNSNNNFQNSNLTNSGSKKFVRDYDKEPIVIYDKTAECIKFSIKIQILLILIPCIVKFVLTGEFSRSITMTLLVVTRLRNDIKQDYSNAKIYFYNTKICKEVNGKIHSEIEATTIKRLLKTINYSLPHDYAFDVLGSKSALAFICLLSFGIFFKFGFLLFLLFVGSILLLLLLPQLIYHLNKDIDSLFDILFIKDKNNNYLNFMISSKNDYKELRQYFQRKTGKNLDKVEKKITALFEFKKEDFK